MPGQRGPVPVPSKDTPRDITQEILDRLDTSGPFTTSDVFSGRPQVEIKAAVDRLKSRAMVAYETVDTEGVFLTEEAETICREGSWEWRVWDVVRERGKVGLKELPTILGAEGAKVGQGNAFKLKWIKKDGDSLLPIAKTVEDSTRQLLQQIQSTNAVSDPKQLADLKKRKLVKTSKTFSYKVRKGDKYAKEMPVEVTDLTSEMLSNGSWQTANFKPYNFKAKGADQGAGALHPLNKVRAAFRQIFFEQGFVEMPTNRFVETGFWNFDALFVPQQHPARDLQDTFFIKDPAKADPPRYDEEAEQAMATMEDSYRTLYESADGQKSKPRDYKQYWEDVKAVHENGKFGSIGYRYKWSADESLRLVLRTHTTAISTWVLHRLAENPRPARYFSIDRVFRNEAVDQTHLAEFHQVEGVIADFGLTLGGLMKFLEDFFAKLGVTGLKFKPAYNPYTEPSMEVFGYHHGLKKWVEIGNSGMFRQEMLEPMGLPPNMRVYGFGLSLERPTMIRYGVNNIRELLGPKCDLAWIQTQGAVRFDKI